MADRKIGRDERLRAAAEPDADPGARAVEAAGRERVARALSGRDEHRARVLWLRAVLESGAYDPDPHQVAEAVLRRAAPLLLQ